MTQRVSIVMCTYNGERFLREQLDSIIGQTYPAYELIIQDDGSTDGTVALINEYARRYPFIKLHINGQRLGYNHNFLSAILKATGDAIAISDQDDIWHKEKIEKQLSRLNEGYSMVFHNSLLFEDSPQVILSCRHKDIPLVSELRLVLKPFIPGHECLFTGRALPLLKALYQKEHDLAYAYVIAAICVTLGELAYIDEGLVYWRRHPQAVTRKDKPKVYGRAEGMLRSLAALPQAGKREIPRRYFNAVSGLPFRSPATRKVVACMQGGTLQILNACLICGRHATVFFPKTTLGYVLKAAFGPLHLIREANFLIR